MAAEHGAQLVSLDDAATRGAANADPTGFIEERNLPLFIDEFQKAPALLDAIKSRVDRARRGGRPAAGMFLLTGSANVWSTLRISESLTGRVERVHLWTLSQGELKGRREGFLSRLLDGDVLKLRDQPVGRKPVAEAVVRGGYPEMVARPPGSRRARWLRSYLEMTLERDVRDLTERGRQLDDLPRLLRVAASRVGGMVDLTSIGGAIEMKRDSVRRYLRLLEMLFLLRRAPAWSGNVARQTIKKPKLWIPDSGLACQLAGCREDEFLADETQMAGALFENFVASEVLKQASRLEQAVELHHFRTAGGREVDIVVEAEDRSLAGIEVKLGATPSESDFSGLAYLRDRLGDRFKAGAVVHTGAETLPFGERLWAVPVTALWS
ncbi:MAG TPA: ATP-binding protein [Solirubrobacterales bacterium]|nr:ATP-binding protein [Solirubrobacterales bacterium]